MRRGKHAAAWLVVASLHLLSIAAAAQPREPDRRDAAGLFDEGKRLFDSGRLEEACDRFVESDALEPKVGTLGMLAACHERRGKLALAYGEYLETERRARATADPRAEFARERAAAIAPGVGQLVVRAARPGEHLEITCNGEPLAAVKLGLSEVVDPGRYEIIARQGTRRWTSTVEVMGGALAVVEIPSLEERRPGASGTTEPVPARPILSTTATPRTDAVDARSDRRTAAFVIGGVGVAGLGVGTTFGILALANNARSDASCDRNDRCVGSGGALRDQARTSATVSTIGFGVGLAGVGAGMVLLLTAPEPRGEPVKPALKLAPAAFSHGGGASLLGRF